MNGKEESMRYAIGIDLGGTAIKYGLVSMAGKLLFSGKLPSCADVSAEMVIGQLENAVRCVMKYGQESGYPVCGIGIGTPGIIDGTQRVVLGAAENIKGWENIPLADRIEEVSGLPVAVNNDANLMGLGETLYGAGKGATHAVFLTIGTGVGGAVVIDGYLFGGYANRGMELGHIPLIANGEPCACGSVGCLEHYASTAALVRQYHALYRQMGKPFAGEKVNGEYVVKRYREGCDIARKCMENHFNYLGRGIAGLVNVFSPQRFILGGGLPESGEYYLRGVEAEVNRHVLPECAVNTRLMIAELGNNAGCMGAAGMAFRLSKGKIAGTGN